MIISTRVYDPRIINYSRHITREETTITKIRWVDKTCINGSSRIRGALARICTLLLLQHMHHFESNCSAQNCIPLLSRFARLPWNLWLYQLDLEDCPLHTGSSPAVLIWRVICRTETVLGTIWLFWRASLLQLPMTWPGFYSISKTCYSFCWSKFTV